MIMTIAVLFHCRSSYLNLQETSSAEVAASETKIMMTHNDISTVKPRIIKTSNSGILYNGETKNLQLNHMLNTKLQEHSLLGYYT